MDVLVYDVVGHEGSPLHVSVKGQGHLIKLKDSYKSLS